MSGSSARALYDWAAADGTQVSLRAGETITVFATPEDATSGWTYAANSQGQKGPSMRFCRLQVVSFQFLRFESLFRIDFNPIISIC